VWLDGEDKGSFSGMALMNGGVLLPIPKENYDSCQFYVCSE
jgi:alpha-galactosidase